MADYDFGNAVTMPGQNTGMWGDAMKAGGGTQGPWDTFSNLTKDRNFLSLLAGTGAKLGYGGVGEMLGVPVQQSIQSQAAQEALGKQEKKRSEWDSMILKLLSGGLTPKEQPGPTSFKVTPDNISLDITRPSNLPSADPRDATSTGIGPSVTGGQDNVPKRDLTDILGF